MPSPRHKRGRSVSINGAVGRRLCDYAEAHGISIRSLVQAILDPVLDGVEEIPISVPERTEHVRARSARQQASDERSRIDEVEQARAMRVALAAALAQRPVPQCPASLIVSAELAETLDDLADGAARKGRTETAESILDASLNRMLDVIERLPASNMCANCTEQITGDARLLPLGKNDALVWICRTCDTEHPRRGRYSFGGGAARDTGPGGVNAGRVAIGKAAGRR